MVTITLLGEPKSTSHIYKVACRPFPSVYMSKDGKTIKESYQWQAKSQYKGKPMAGSLKIDVGLYFGTKRKSDIDNFSKLLLDALKGLVFVDDSQIMEASFSKHYDKENPRIVLTVKEL